MKDIVKYSITSVWKLANLSDSFYNGRMFKHSLVNYRSHTSYSINSEHFKNLIWVCTNKLKYQRIPNKYFKMSASVISVDFFVYYDDYDRTVFKTLWNSVYGLITTQKCCPLLTLGCKFWFQLGILVQLVEAPLSTLNKQ